MAGSVAGTQIAAVDFRLILDSHLAWTPEFEISFADGNVGRGSAPRGETLSIFEAESGSSTSLDYLVDAQRRLVGRAFTQETLDSVARDLAPRWGPQASLALSVAFYMGQEANRAKEAAAQPRLLLNLLNGGQHAYTNPVVSDFHEFMLIARSDDLVVVSDAYRALLQAVAAELRVFPREEVAGNPVHRLGEQPNEACLAFVRHLLEREGVETLFGIAVDASAGDWWNDGTYELRVSGQSLDPSQLRQWWLHLIDEYGIELLEDPLGERDGHGWSDLHALRPPSCALLGDNYTSTSLDQLLGTGKADDVDGVLVKPNQNGTVSGTLAFAAAAREAGLRVIASHRSVETESVFLVRLARDMRAEALKIGPFHDFTAVVKFNEMLRGSGGQLWPG